MSAAASSISDAKLCVRAERPRLGDRPSLSVMHRPCATGMQCRVNHPALATGSRWAMLIMRGMGMFDRAGDAGSLILRLT